MKNKAIIPVSLLIASGGAAPAITLPYTFTPPVSGAWAAPWVAPTWSANQNTPTLGAELLTDPGLEATYTDGLCDSLTKVGSPTVAESADAHGGSKAQAFTSAAVDNIVGIGGLTPTINTWYLFSVWAKRLSGANGSIGLYFHQGGGAPGAFVYTSGITSASYTQRSVARKTNTLNNTSVIPAYEFGTPGDAVVVDDMSLKTITESSLFAIVDSQITNQTVRGKWTWTRDGFCGVVARCNLARNSYLVAYYFANHPIYSYCVLDKCVNGVTTNLIADWTNTPVAGGGETPTNSQWLEIRCSGNTVQLFHNDIQVGTDKTVSDAEIVSNTYAGTFSTGGGSQLASFFAGVTV